MEFSSDFRSDLFHITPLPPEVKFGLGVGGWEYVETNRCIPQGYHVVCNVFIQKWSTKSIWKTLDYATDIKWLFGGNNFFGSSSIQL